MGKSGKGSQYERDMAVKLSLWYSQGKRDDLLWRSSQSGGRSTQRAKKGKQTANQQGDLAPTDPSIMPLTNLVSIEIKRGYTCQPLDLIDIPDKNKTNVYKDFIDQCLREMEEGGKKFFWLIYRKDRRHATICMPISFYHKYREIFGYYLDKYIWVKYNSDLELFICELDGFLNWFDPSVVFGDYKEEEE